jgi:hypothetical protein
MTDRTHVDGKPFYCADCGAGYGEYIACEYPRCTLESEAKALKRKKNWERHLKTLKSKKAKAHGS